MVVVEEEEEEGEVVAVVGGKDDIANVVHCHVPVDAVLSKLVGHDPPGRVQDRDIEAVGLRGDLFGGRPVAQVSFHEGDFARVLCPELVGDVFQFAVDGFLRHADHEAFGEVVLKEVNVTP